MGGSPGTHTGFTGQGMDAKAHCRGLWNKPAKGSANRWREKQRKNMTYLYRHFDRENALLYVGITAFLADRFVAHKTSSDWFKDVATVKVEKFKDRDSALEAEAKAIKNEKPIFNISSGRKIRAQKKNNPSIEKACILVGGQSKMAVLLSVPGAPVSRQSVNNWIRFGKVPPDKAPSIERITKGKVRVEELCPDFPWQKRSRRSRK